jgi:hypothetical protein
LYKIKISDSPQLAGTLPDEKHKFISAKSGARVELELKTSFNTRDGIISGPGAAFPFSFDNAAASSSSVKTESLEFDWKAHSGSTKDSGSSGV